MPFDVGSIVGHAKLDTQGWTSGQNILSKSFKTLKVGALAMGAAVAGAFTLSIKAANEFNKEFANVRTLVDEAKVNTKAMKQELLGLDARLGSSKDLAKGLYQALSAGVEPAKAVRFVGESAKFAKAALVDTNTAVDVITGALNAYRLEANQTTKVSDIFFKTIQKGKTTGQELASSIGDIFSVAAQTGVSIEELGASIATMTTQNIKSAEATTQLNAIISAFLKPSSEMTAALKEQGIESGATLIETEGLTGALEFLQNASNGNKEELAKLLPNIRAFKGALALTGIQSKVYTDNLKEMNAVGGETDEAFQKQELTFETLQNSIEKVAIKVGDALLPTVYKLTNNITTFVNSAEGMDKISIAVAGVAAGFAVAKDIMADLITPLRDVFSGIIETLQESFGKLAGKTEESVTAFDVLSGVAKIVGIAFRVIGKAIETIIKGITNTIVTIKEAGETINSFFKFLRGKASWDEVKANAEETGRAFIKQGIIIYEGYEDIITTVVDEFSKLPDEVESLSTKTKTSWDKVFANTKASIKGGLSDVSNEITEKLQTVGKDLNGLAKIAETTGNTLAMDIYKSLEKGGEGLDEFIKKAKETNNELAIQMGEMVKTMLDSGEDMNKDWKAIMSKLSKTIKTGLDEATKYAGYALDNMGSLFNSISETVTMAMENQLASITMEGEAEVTALQEKYEEERESEDQKYEAELQALDNRLATGNITEAVYREQKSQLENDHNKKQDEITKKYENKKAEQKKKQLKKENEQKKKMFEAEKAFSIANIWIDAASGIIAAWAGAFMTIPNPIAAAVIAGVMTAAIIGMAVAQTVVVSQQQFVPAAATGGTVTQSGMIMTDEEGGEIKRYNTGDVIIPNDISRQIANNVNNNGGSKIQINMAGAFSGAIISSDMDFEKMLDRIINRLSERLALRS
jgi:TP901 family phage tail tape measure protein